MEQFEASDRKKATTPSADQIDQSVGAGDDYERAMQHAQAMMEIGFHLGGTHELDRSALHDRKVTRLVDSQ